MKDNNLFNNISFSHIKKILIDDKKNKVNFKKIINFFKVEKNRKLVFFFYRK